MMRITKVIFFSLFCLVSILGHGGFCGLRAATLEWASADNSVHACPQKSPCCQPGTSQKPADKSDGCPDGCPDGCVVCHFFSHFNAQAIASATSFHFFSSPDVELYSARDNLVPFDCELPPRPRGPPSRFA